MTTLILHHGPNCDVSDGYWQAPADPPLTMITVKDLTEARSAFTSWRDKNGLGGGNMMGDCGTVTTDGVEVAKFSYNGRCWTPAPYGTPEHKPITI